MGHKKISIVIAAYNEKECIEGLTKRIVAVCEKEKYPYELIFVIDAHDGTEKILEKAIQKEKWKHVKYSFSKKPRGFANAFRKGFSMVAQDSMYICTMDADLNHQPESLPLFFKAMHKRKHDIIIGSRYISGSVMEKRGFVKEKVSRLANIVAPYVLGLSIHDISSGYRLYKTKALLDIVKHTKLKDFEFLPEILYCAKKKYSMSEIPITFILRKQGKSKFDMMKAMRGYIRLIFGI